MRKFSVALLGFSLFLWGCSTATERLEFVNQDRIYQSYTVSYYQESNEVFTHAEFRFGDLSGTTLKVGGNSSVRHANYALRERNLSGTFYYASAVGFQRTHEFTFIDDGGKRFVNSAIIPQIGIPETFPAEISKRADVNFPWQGEALAENETVMLTLRDVASASEYYFYARTRGDTAVLVTRSVLAELPVGSKQMQFKRVKRVDLQQGTTRGGEITTDFLTRRREVRLVECPHFN